MRCHIERDWSRDAVKVWLYQPGRDMNAQVIGIADDGYLTMQNFEPGQDAPPSFILPTEALEALVKAGSDVLPPSDATVDALQDARAVRDQALGMVERIIDSDLAREAGGHS